MKNGRVRAILYVTAMLAAFITAVPACTSGGSGTAELSQETIQGVLQSLQGKQLNIKLDDGRTATVIVSDQQATQAQTLVGNQIRILAKTSPDGKTREAGSVESRGQKSEFTGTVQSMSAASWTIGGKTFSVNVNTEIGAYIGVGAMVKVEYITLLDGKFMATELKLAESENTTQTTTSTGTNPGPGTGAQLYATFCSGCHGLSRQGGSSPALTPARLSGESDSEIVRTISQGEDDMPGFASRLTAQQINTIVQFLRSPVTTTTTMTTATPVYGTGAQLYAMFCTVCHGASRQGGTGPALTSTRLSGESDSEIVKAISQGEDDMPGFASRLTAQQINTIVQFLRSPVTTTTTMTTPATTTTSPTIIPTTTPPPTTTPSSVSFSAVIQPILAASCVSCHGPGGAAGVNLSTYAAVSAGVTPGNATTSLLYRSLTGNGVTLMPPGVALSATQVQQFAAWINQGALNN